MLHVNQSEIIQSILYENYKNMAMIKIPCTDINEGILILKSVTHNIHACKNMWKLDQWYYQLKLSLPDTILFDNVNSNINDTLYIETYSWLTLLKLLRFQSLVIQLNIIDLANQML